MSFVRDATYGLYGALRLARFDRSGMRWLDGSEAGAWRSFRALWLLIPGYLLLLLLVGTNRPLAPGGLLHRLAGEAVGEVVEIAGYLLVTRQVLTLMGGATRFAAYVSAYNWSSVLQVAVLILASLLMASGLLPADLGNGLITLVALALLVYSGFVAMASLEIGVAAAAGFVLLEVVITMLVSGITDALVFAPA